MEITQKCINSNQLIFLETRLKKDIFKILKAIDCQALLFSFFSTTAEQDGLVQQTVQIVVRFTHTI